jgi:hypothetical protein
MHTLMSRRAFAFRIRELCCAAFLFPILEVAGQSIPLVDHHQHPFRPAPAGQAFGPPAISGTDLIKLLDQARIQRAVVLSVAYQFGNPNKPPLSDEFEKVKAENDWTSREVAQYPDRLRGFCGVNNHSLQPTAASRVGLLVGTGFGRRCAASSVDPGGLCGGMWSSRQIRRWD